MQINGTSPFLAIHFRSGGQQAKTVEPEILDFTPDCVGTYASQVAEPGQYRAFVVLRRHGGEGLEPADPVLKEPVLLAEGELPN